MRSVVSVFIYVLINYVCLIVLIFSFLTPIPSLHPISHFSNFLPHTPAALSFLLKLIRQFSYIKVSQDSKGRCVGFRCWPGHVYWNSLGGHVKKCYSVSGGHLKVRGQGRWSQWNLLGCVTSESDGLVCADQTRPDQTGPLLRSGYARVGRQVNVSLSVLVIHSLPSPPRPCYRDST